MKKILLLLSLFPLFVKAQPTAVYGSSGFGGKYMQGGFICWYGDTITDVSYDRTVSHPYINMISHNGRIYGMAGCDIDYRFRPSICKIFYADSITDQLHLMNDRTLRGTLSTASLGKDKFGGFSVDGDYMAQLNQSGDSAIEVFRLSDFKLVGGTSYPNNSAHCTPLIKGDLVYYFIQNGTEIVLNELNFKTGTVRTIVNTTYDEFGSPVGQPFIVDNKLFITTEGFGDNGGIRSVDLIKQEVGTVFKFTYSGGYQSYGKFCKVGEWYYNVCTKSTFDKGGSVYRFHPGSGEFEYLYEFSATAGTPLYGLVSFKDKLYGIISKIDQKISNAVFELDTNGANFRIVEEFPSVINNQVNYYANNLFVHNDELYVVSPINSHDEKGNGEILRLNLNNDSHKHYEHYVNSSNSLGRGKPVFYNGKFYGASDSTIYSYEVDSKTIEKIAELQIDGKKISSYTHGLTAYNGKLYGEGRWKKADDYIRVLYTVDLITRVVKIAKELPIEFFDLWDEMCVSGNKLYSDKLGSTGSYIFEYDLTTGDTAYHQTSYPACEMINSKFAQNGQDLYYSTYNRDCMDGTKGKLVRYNTANKNFDILVDFNTKPNRRTPPINVLFHEGKVYGFIGDTINNTMIYYYDVQSKEYNEIMVFEDSMIMYTNANISGDVIYGIANKGLENTMFYYDISSKTLNYYYESAKSDFTVALPFLNFPYNNTGIKELNSLAAPRWNVLPNPASKEIRFNPLFDQGSAQLRITDINGKLICTGTSQSVVNVENWSAGVYMVRFEDEKGISVQRFVKQ